MGGTARKVDPMWPLTAHVNVVFSENLLVILRQYFTKITKTTRLRSTIGSPRGMVLNQAPLESMRGTSGRMQSICHLSPVNVAQSAALHDLGSLEGIPASWLPFLPGPIPTICPMTSTSCSTTDQGTMMTEHRLGQYMTSIHILFPRLFFATGTHPIDKYISFPVCCHSSYHHTGESLRIQSLLNPSLIRPYSELVSERPWVCKMQQALL